MKNGLISMSRGCLELILAPEAGGSVARFDHVSRLGRREILRGCTGMPQGPLAAASFPLVPYCNRIRDGRFSFRGREIAISPNMESEPNPLHGDGWRSPWQVERATGEEAELLFRHEPGEWPWGYEARQFFHLDPSGLTVRLACRNLSDSPMPCGLGLHPYFPCTEETRLDTRVTHVWTIDEEVLPVEKVPSTGRYDLSDRLVCGQDLDNGFGGWGGSARMHTPGDPFAIELSSDDADFFQLYSPSSGGVYVAEPVTHANAALNEPEESWPELGLRVLAPGEEMSLTARLDVKAAD